MAKKKLTTQAEYRRVLERIAEQHGQKPARLLEPRHIYNMQDAIQGTPGAANTLVRMLKLVLGFAVKRGHIPTNPAARVELLKVGEWRAWTDDECAAFERCWSPGSMQRRAYALALYTGQRLSDLVRMTRAHRKDGAIYVAQSKTDKSLWIAEHKNLAAELSLGNAEHMSLLTTSRGKAFDHVYFGAWFAEAIDKAGLPNDCVLHGLRKTAATRLADAGCSEAEIQSVTGQSPAMVAHYIKGRNQRRAARSAISKLEQNTK